MLPYLFTPECWERSMHYSTTACIYQADSQLETSCTHEGGTRAGHVTTSRSRKQVRDRLARSLSLSLSHLDSRASGLPMFMDSTTLYRVFKSARFTRHKSATLRCFIANNRISVFSFPRVDREGGTGHLSSILLPPPVVAPFVFENTVPWFMEFFLLSRTRKYSRKVLNEIKIVYFLDRLKSKR